MILIDVIQVWILLDVVCLLIYDFDLLEQEIGKVIEYCSLCDLNFVVFDMEIIGLMLNKDEIVQIGVVWVVGGWIVLGEVIDQLVNLGCVILFVFIKVYGIFDDMVVNVLGVGEVVFEFYVFVCDLVIVVYNVLFDMVFLYCYGKIFGCVWDYLIFDIVFLFVVVFGVGDVYMLDVVCEWFDIEILEDVWYMVLGDVQVMVEVFCKFLLILQLWGFDIFGKVIEQMCKYGWLLKDMN